MIPAQRTGEHDAAPYPASTLSAAIAGDSEAFAELWRAHHDMVFRYAYYRLPDRHGAEDIVSETFVRALRGIGRFHEKRGTAGLEGWLVTIARNLIADVYKSSRHKREFAVGEIFDGELVTDGPEQTVVDTIAAETIHAAIGDLNPLQQACIRARFLEQLSVAETAERLDSNDGAIKTLQYRAVRTLARDPRLTEELT